MIKMQAGTRLEENSILEGDWMLDRLMTTPEVTKAIQRNRQIVYDLRKQGVLKGVKVYRSWYFFETSVMEYLKNRREREDDGHEGKR